MKFLFCLFALALPASAFVNIPLAGTVKEDGSWTGLSSANYGAPNYPTGIFTSATPWGASVAQNSSGGSGAVLSKIAGNGYFSASSFIYTGSLVPGTSGTFRVSDSAPQASLANLLFQIDMSQAPLSMSLNYNGGSQALAANFFKYVAGPSTTYQNLVWQWDLSGLGTITSYEINFVADEHTSLKTLGVNTSDSFAQVIPEPSSAMIGAAAIGLAFIRRRRA